MPPWWWMYFHTWCVDGSRWYLGSDGSGQDGAGLISSLILINLIKILALIGAIFMRDPDCPLDMQQ